MAVEVPVRPFFLNAFFMPSVSHVSHGQWRNPYDTIGDDFTRLEFWVNLARLLDKSGGIIALFLADQFGTNEFYGGNTDAAYRAPGQVPIMDSATVGPFCQMDS